MQKPSVEAGAPVSALETPALVCDLDQMESNLAELASLCRRYGLKFRPHFKTHKSPDIARRQIASGAIGLTVAKLTEAEVLAEAGLNGILLATPVVEPSKLRRLAELATRIDIMVVADCEEHLVRLSEAARAAGTTIDLLIEIDVGQHRCGCEPEETVSLVKRVHELPGLRYRGIQGYDGQNQHIISFAERAEKCRASMSILAQCARDLKEAGLTPEIVTTGGTGTVPVVAEFPEITEVQPGSYVFMDREYQHVIEQNPSESLLGVKPSVTLLSTVLTSKAPGRVICDAGMKVLSTDAGFAQPVGIAAEYTPAGEEHGNLLLEEGRALPAVGDRVHLVPSHICTTVNLHDYIYAVRRGVVEEVWPVAARGCAQ